MVRHDEEMFKVHPESACKWGGAGDPPPNKQYWVGDQPSLPDDVTVPRRHPDTYPAPGLIIPQVPIPPGVAPVNASIDAKLNVIIELLTELKRMLK